MDYLTPISSAVMALVWVIYFQVFFVQYKRNNRPYLVIHHAQNENPDAMCLLVNMGKEPVHVQCVQVVTVSQSGTEQVMTVTEYRRVNADDQNIQRALRQGPLDPGGYLVLGSFRNIILGNKSEDEDSLQLLEDISEVELRAAVVHGPSKYPVGVRRRFLLKHLAGTRIYPRNIYSEQLIRKRDRNVVRRWLEQELNPERMGEDESDSSNQSD
ncbi:MAG: hypothetical protein R3280_05180 [Marinobacter sp.]|uniref:hypothetical protein n=1 Tax=Marinobacter sp. TaxID=50741 RepID=UPI00299EE5DE|nr:hypothetical protein [Marinobacter sp.]MDX1634004.1 hypothetical protein [Marinobacter sp.]